LIAACQLSISYDDRLHDDDSVRRETIAKGTLEATERGSEASLHHSTLGWVDQQHLHRYAMRPAPDSLPETAHDGLNSM
jgi:hypothetical protein